MGPTLARRPARRTGKTVAVALQQPLSREAARADVGTIEPTSSTGADPRLPQVPNVVLMAGEVRASDAPSHMGAEPLLPALVSEVMAEQLIAFSTGCVYPFVASIGQRDRGSLAPPASTPTAASAVSA
jgi:hypothetical protein